MGRGLERRRIFYADADKQNFLARLGEALARSGFQCLAWAVMTNHYHLLIRVGDQPLVKFREFVAQDLGEGDSDALLGGGLVRGYGGWEGLKRLRREHMHCIGDERILGDSDFVERALAQDTLAVEKGTQRILDGWDLERLISRVCQYCGVKEDRLTQKARGNDLSLAKALICLWGSQELKLSLREIAHPLSISQPAVSQWVKRGEEYCREQGIEFEVIDS
jgi:hypothetical protein